MVTTLVALELGWRLWRGPAWLFDWSNLIVAQVEHRTEWGPSCSHVHDLLLGWMPNPGFKSHHFNATRDGYRVTSSLLGVPTGRVVALAVGDSFTAGDEVDDGEAWPAYLQELIGHRAVNAGVSGYGLDQTVLRAEKAAEVLHPASLIVEVFQDDLRRTEFSVLWAHGKPYFAPKGHALELQNVPVPLQQPGCSLPFWQRLLGWSVVLNETLSRLHFFEEHWFYVDKRALKAGTGYKIVCPLMERVARIGIHTLVVAQYDRLQWTQGEPDALEDRARTRYMLACAESAGLAVLDLFDALHNAVERDGVDALYRKVHHSPLGNRLVAEQIGRELARLKMLDEN